MILLRRVCLVAGVALAQPLPAQSRAEHELRIGTEIKLKLAEPISSKTQVKGDPVAMRTVEEVSVNGHLLIPAGTLAVGQVADARAKGAMGMTGKLAIRPLYIRIGDTTVRLGGATMTKGSVTAGAVAGMVVLTPGFTGRSAYLAAGTHLLAIVERTVVLPEIEGGQPRPLGGQ